MQRRTQPELLAQRLERVQVRHQPRLPHVPQPARLDAACHGIRLGVRVHTERGDDVADGEAALWPHVPLAVHHDGHARRGGDDARRRADHDVLGAPIVRAADVEQALDVRREGPHAGAHGIDVAEQLFGRLAAVALEEQEGAGLGARRHAVHDGFERETGLFARQVSAVGRPLPDGGDQVADAGVVFALCHPAQCIERRRQRPAT